MSNFSVGQKIKYHDYIGKILSLYGDGVWLVQFNTPYPSFCHHDGGQSPNPNRYYIDEKYMVKTGRSPSKKTRVLNKCKKLWNESNWVKENPEYGY